MSKEQIQEIIKAELPHLKKVIDDLENRGLCAGALLDIYKNLNEATQENK